MAVTNGYDKERRLSIAAAPGSKPNIAAAPNIASGQGIGTAATHINDKPNDGKQYTPGQDVTDAKKRMEETEQKKPGRSISDRSGFWIEKETETADRSHDRMNAVSCRGFYDTGSEGAGS